jgi:hypothetical protein
VTRHLGECNTSRRPFQIHDDDDDALTIACEQSPFISDQAATLRVDHQPFRLVTRHPGEFNNLHPTIQFTSTQEMMVDNFRDLYYRPSRDPSSRPSAVPSRDPSSR